MSPSPRAPECLSSPVPDYEVHSYLYPSSFSLQIHRLQGPYLFVSSLSHNLILYILQGQAQVPSI